MNFKRLFNSTKIVQFANGRYGIRRGTGFTRHEFYDFDTHKSVISCLSWVGARNGGTCEVTDLVLVHKKFNLMMGEVDTSGKGLDVTKDFDVLVAEYKLSGRPQEDPEGSSTGAGSQKKAWSSR